MPRLLVFAFCVMVCAAQPARASLISPIDPIIGVRGERTGSPNVTDGSIYPLSTCGDPALGSFFCAPYQNNVGVITSIDLSFWDMNGLPIPNMFFAPSSEVAQPNYFPSELSDLEELLNGDDLFTVRLCDGSNSIGVAACTSDSDSPILLLSLESFYDEQSFFDFASLFVFSNVDGFVSVRAVNTIPNANLPANDVPISVPEPATTALLGLGAAAAIARRRALRRTA